MNPNISIEDINSLDQATLAALVQDLQQSKIALESRQFIEASLSRFADIMRWRADDTLKNWVDRLLDELMGTVNGLHSNLYMIEQNSVEEPYLSLIGAYAYNPDGFETRVELGEGLIGQVARSRKSQYINDANLVSVKTQSGLSGLIPAVLMLEPLIYNDSLEGVLEISSSEDFPDYVRDLMRQLSGVIGANLLTIRNQEQTQRLYREMQVNAQRLAAHEEEMRKNIETMTTTSEELERVKNEIEQKQRQLERISANVPGMLFQYQYNLITLEEGYTYASERSRNILYIDPEEVLKGANVISDRVHKDDKMGFSDAFIESREKLIPLSWTGRIIAPDGTYRWVRSEATPTQINEYTIVWDGYLYDITQEKEREQAQQKQQQQINLAANLAELGFLEFDLDNDTITFSEELRRIFKLPEDPDLNNFINRIHPEDRELLSVALDELKDSFREFDLEYRSLLPDKKIRWFKSSGKILTGVRQNPERALAITQDITQQKLRALEIEEKNRTLSQQEEEMRKNLDSLEESQNRINELLERQNLLFESSRDAIWIFKDEKTLDCNPAFLQLYGFKNKEEISNISATDLFPEFQPSGEQSLKIFEGLISNTIKSGSTLWEWKNIQRDKTLFDAEILLSHFEYKGESFLQATIRNISDRKQQQAESLKRQMQMELAENLGHLGAFEVDINTEAVNWSRSLKDILDLHTRQVENISQWNELIHPDDRDTFNSCIQNTVSGKTSSSAADFRVMMMDESYKWVQLNVVATYNESWELNGLEGMCQDITLAKERENLIQQTNRELGAREHELRSNLQQLENAQKELKLASERHQLLFETARDAIFIMEGTKITECNPSAVKMFDVPNKELLILRNLQDLSPEKQPNGDKSIEIISALVQQGMVGIGNKVEWVASTYKNTPFYVEVSFSPFIYNGKMMLQTIVRDISNRKKREAEVQRQQAIIGSIVNNDYDKVIVVDKTLNVILANQAGTEYFADINPNFAIGVNILEYIPIQDRDEFINDCHNVFQGKKTRSEKEVFTNRGVFTFESDYYPIRDNEDQIIGACVTLRDVTNRRLNDIENSEKDFQLSQSEEAARYGTWSITEGQNYMNWSPGMYSLFQIDDTETELTIDDFLAFVLPEDQKHIQNHLEQLKNSNDALEMAFRATISNETRWFRLYSKPVRGPKSELIKITGLVQDITQAQRASSEIEKNYYELEKIQEQLELNALRANQIFQTAHEAVVSLDKSMHITSYNEKFLHYIEPLGIDLTIDSHFLKTVLPQEQELFIDSLNQIFADGKPIEVFRTIETSDDINPIKYRTFISPIFDKYGSVLEAVVFHYEIKEAVLSQEIDERITNLEKEISQSKKQIKDLQNEKNLSSKKIIEYKDKETSLLQLIQLKDDEIRDLKKK